MVALADVEAGLDPVGFLARSPNRVAVLDALAADPGSRDDLVSRIDAQRVTLDRILDEFRDRELVVQDGGRYETTQLGQTVAGEFARLVSRVRATNPPASIGPARPADPALAEVAFLARSSTRLEVLARLREDPRTRQDLKRTTDVSRSSLSRILSELDDRRLIDRTNHRCVLTDRGRRVTVAVTDTLANLAAADRLRDVLGWLPTEDFDFELSRLADADIVAADWDDPTKSIHRVAELVRDAGNVRIVGPGATREVAEAVRTQTRENGGTFRGIVDGETIDWVGEDPDLARSLRAVVGADDARLRRFDGELPALIVCIVDDVVVLCGHEDRGPALEAIETDDEAVREWAESYFASYRTEAVPVEQSAFAP